MKLELYHEIDKEPEPEEAGTIRIVARIFCEDNLTFSTLSLTKDFLDDECQSKQDLNYFLLEAGFNNDVIFDALSKLIDYVDEVTCPASIEYSPGCALDIKLDIDPEEEDTAYVDDESWIEESVQALFDEAYIIRLRPACKAVVKSLTRKIYKKKIAKETKKKKKIRLEDCRICLEEFSNGSKVVTLPCGHDFDDECIVKWFETNHVCPLCRFELPCED